VEPDDTERAPGPASLRVYTRRGNVTPAAPLAPSSDPGLLDLRGGADAHGSSGHEGVLFVGDAMSLRDAPLDAPSADRLVLSRSDIWLVCRALDHMAISHQTVAAFWLPCSHDTRKAHIFTAEDCKVLSENLRKLL